MQDVTPPDNGPRSIRDIPVARRREPRTEFEPPARRGGRGRSLWLWAIAVVVVSVVVGMGASIFFSGATVDVFPRQASVTLPPSLIAGLDAPVGSLSYKLMSVSQTDHRSAPATGTKQVTTAAQGTATIFNAYSTSPQKLITNTRFQAPDGKIYRIHQAVTVPGGIKNADGTLTPGTLKATLYADKPGPDYNRGDTKFTIPGFQGSPRYKSFSAEAQSISGGASGTEPAVSTSDMQTAQTAMEKELQQALTGNASSQVPHGFVSVPGTLSIEYGAPQVGTGSNGGADITEAATATEAILRSSDLANAVAKQEVQQYAGEPIDFSDPTKLSLSLATGTPYAANASTITFNLSGTALLVWQFDPTQLQQALVGKNKDDFNAIIKTFGPAVAKATASVRPFWKTSFPSNKDKIQIKIENPSS